MIILIVNTYLPAIGDDDVVDDGSRRQGCCSVIRAHKRHNLQGAIVSVPYLDRSDIPS
jgi:hypothetical protein